MTENTSLINIGELSKPATVLIEKVSDAIGGFFKPWQIRRIGQAEAEVEKIKAETQIAISELNQRALFRFLAEEVKKQNNIEEITLKALPQISPDAKPENMEDDWIANFFDKSRLISSDEMQFLWSKVLAGEANTPGTFSKRTVNFLSSMDKSDALLFQSLCRFGWHIGNIVPLIFDITDEIYKKHDITFNSLTHLEDIGLLKYGSLMNFKRVNLPKEIALLYYGRILKIEFEKETNNELKIGSVKLSKIGQELELICDPDPIPEFYEYVNDTYKKNDGFKVSSSEVVLAPYRHMR